MPAAGPALVSLSGSDTDIEHGALEHPDLISAGTDAGEFYDQIIHGNIIYYQLKCFLRSNFSCFLQFFFQKIGDKKSLNEINKCVII